MPHLTREEVSPRDVLHVTLRCVSGLPSLRREAPRGILLPILRAEKDKKGFRLIHFAIRGNHLHLVCEADDALSLARGIQRIASRVARAVNRLFGRKGRVFTDRYHRRTATTPREVRGLLRYVLLNDHKDSLKRGEFVEGIDPYSSGRWFDGWAEGVRAPPSDDTIPAVVPPKCWLLTTGWRRYGRIAAVWT
jgi:REP element-mobilizing transposase RayT